MKAQEFLEYHQQCTKKMFDICKAKNQDYSGEADFAFANFMVVETGFNVASVEQGFFTRMCDKFSRIGNFIKKGVLAVKDESIEDTILDFCNYLILMAAYLKWKRTQSLEKKAPSITPSER